jgi:hypothetical protein
MIDSVYMVWNIKAIAEHTWEIVWLWLNSFMKENLKWGSCISEDRASTTCSAAPHTREFWVFFLVKSWRF